MMRISLQLLLAAAAALNAVCAFAPASLSSKKLSSSLSLQTTDVSQRQPHTTTTTTLFADLTLYGSQGSRSPLVNWAAYELGLDFEMGDLSQNPHPFGQIPCLVSKNNGKEQVIFESGAILLYLDAFAKQNEDHKGEIYSWVQWANASLDPICFLETPQGKVYDTGLKNTQNKKIHKLNDILGVKTFLVSDGKKLTVADVAVASYLLYVVQFFPDIDLSIWPNMVRFMKDCASREAYAKAYGATVQAFLVEKLEAMGSGKTTDKKLFGMF